MQTILKVDALLLDSAKGDFDGNLLKIEQACTNLKTDILLLPEMFPTGFYTKAEELVDDGATTLAFMKKLAAGKNFAVAGSVAVKIGERYRNRFYFVQPDGQVDFYDKRHLFAYGAEDEKFDPGHIRKVINYKGFRILLQVCYDLRFPVSSRNREDYDLAFYIASWPEPRLYAWDTLLKARAIENQAFVFGHNRIGTDAYGQHFPESSFCVFADGRVCSTLNSGFVSAELDLTQLEQFRQDFPFYKDRDNFELLS